MADEYVYRVVLKDGCQRSKALGEVREGDPLWLFGAKAPGTPAPGLLLPTLRRRRAPTCLARTIEQNIGVWRRSCATARS